MVVTWRGDYIALACDGKCEKAFGINHRPKVILDENNEDDYYFLADHEVGIAPVDTGVYEGGHAKPTDKQHNKWCWRECERSVKGGNKIQSFDGRRYNIPGENADANDLD